MKGKVKVDQEVATVRGTLRDLEASVRYLRKSLAPIPYNGELDKGALRMSLERWSAAEERWSDLEEMVGGAQNIGRAIS